MGGKVSVKRCLGKIRSSYQTKRSLGKRSNSRVLRSGQREGGREGGGKGKMKMLKEGKRESRKEEKRYLIRGKK